MNLFFLSFFAFVAIVVAQNSSSVVCIAGQCLQGFSNTTIGTSISAPGAQANVLLLPGQYTATTNPQLLHDLLTSSSSSLSPSSGFENSSSSRNLPLNIALSPGLAIYSEALYGGNPGFTSLPTAPIGNSSTPITANSLSLSSNVWVALNIGSQSQRVVVWDSVPDVAQLPISGSLSLLDMQSSACSPPCSGAGVCSASGTCTCPTGFTGTSCESCAKGFFGPKCQACPANCSSCDEGINGSGRCLTPTFANAPSSCNCLNGQCASGGQCTCNTGWTTADNGTLCAKCSPGFFLSSTGDCHTCQLGCSSCADGTGVCQTCKPGFTQDANDKTKCNPSQSVTGTGTVCPDGSFSDGTKCQACSPSCRTCRGATSNDCVICASGTYAFNGGCVAADGNGVCQGTNLIADNNKVACDTCGAKCTTCKIPNFSVASTVNDLQCTGCLPGSFLSQGKCVESCPQGTFVDPKDNITCTVAPDPPLSVSLALHPHPWQDLMANAFLIARPTPSRTQRRNNVLPVIQTARPAPASPSTSARLVHPSALFSIMAAVFLLAAKGSSSTRLVAAAKHATAPAQAVLAQGGKCVDAGCTSGTSVIPGLGVCLSNLVQVPTTTNGEAPLPTITGLDKPTIVESKPRLEWWQILLMALGCAFIFMVFIMCWRRRMRKRRAAATKEFARAKNLDAGGAGWRWRMLRFGERFFGHRPSRRANPPQAHEDIKLRDLEEGGIDHTHQTQKKRSSVGQSTFDMDGLIGAYEYRDDDRKSSKKSHAPSVLPSLDVHHHHHHHHAHDNGHSKDLNRLSGSSLYSEITGKPRHTPETKQPVRTKPLFLDPNASRFSSSSYGSSLYSKSSNNSSSNDLLRKATTRTTDAQRYAREVRPTLNGADGSKVEAYPHTGLLVDTTDDVSVTRGAYWMQPQYTGASSNNPFRK
ncbi:hypothetical protein V5O48_001688 [Marasmius crinis-equi]|uniref:EGF-like domain-containing protein n=1 Tax=Marasmius crinis-equi TaxID=585013 RepID=A0ABR3FY02_9AGAR